MSYQRVSYDGNLFPFQKLRTSEADNNKENSPAFKAYSKVLLKPAFDPREETIKRLKAKQEVFASITIQFVRLLEDLRRLEPSIPPYTKKDLEPILDRIIDEGFRDGVTMQETRDWCLKVISNIKGNILTANQRIDQFMVAGYASVVRLKVKMNKDMKLKEAIRREMERMKQEAITNLESNTMDTDDNDDDAKQFLSEEIQLLQDLLLAKSKLMFGKFGKSTTTPLTPLGQRNAHTFDGRLGGLPSKRKKEYLQDNGDRLFANTVDLDFDEPAMSYLPLPKPLVSTEFKSDYSQSPKTSVSSDYKSEFYQSPNAMKTKRSSSEISIYSYSSNEFSDDLVKPDSNSNDLSSRPSSSVTIENNTNEFPIGTTRAIMSPIFNNEENELEMLCQFYNQDCLSPSTVELTTDDLDTDYNPTPINSSILEAELKKKYGLAYFDEENTSDQNGMTYKGKKGHVQIYENRDNSHQHSDNISPETIATLVDTDNLQYIDDTVKNQSIDGQNMTTQVEISFPFDLE